MKCKCGCDRFHTVKTVCHDVVVTLDNHYGIVVMEDSGLSLTQPEEQFVDPLVCANCGKTHDINKTLQTVYGAGD